MQQFEMRDHCDDFEEIAQFWDRVWSSEYRGKTWVVLPDAAFFRWLVGPESGAQCHVAYKGTKLAGCVFSAPYSLRIGSSIQPSGLVFGLTVDPDHRGLALPLVERLRRHNAERGIAFALGLVVSDATSPSHRFWTKYAEAFPQNLTFLFPLRYWVKGLASPQLARAGIKRWERLVTRAMGPLNALTPHRHDPHVRLYRPADLERCAQILDKASAGFDWAMTWPPEQLTRRLEGPACGTLVFERDGCVQGMVNYHCVVMQGRERVVGAVIALWADDGLSSAERVRLLGHVCNHLRERGVHVVTAQCCAMMPAPAFLANLFLPTPAPWHLVAVWTRTPVPMSMPKTWSLLVM
jgi:hypothetical protein